MSPIYPDKVGIQIVVERRARDPAARLMFWKDVVLLAIDMSRARGHRVQVRM